MYGTKDQTYSLMHIWWVSYHVSSGLVLCLNARQQVEQIRCTTGSHSTNWLLFERNPLCDLHFCSAVCTDLQCVGATGSCSSKAYFGSKLEHYVDPLLRNLFTIASCRFFFLFPCLPLPFRIPLFFPDFFFPLEPMRVRSSETFRKSKTPVIGLKEQMVFSWEWLWFIFFNYVSALM